MVMETYVAVAVAIVIASIVFYYRKRKNRKNECHVKEESKEENAVSPKVESTVSQGENIEVHSDKTVNVPTEFPVYWFDENGNRAKGVAKMAQGLQVFDEKGNCIVDLNSNVAKVIGRFTTQGTSGTLTVEGGKPWAMLLQSPEAYDVIRKHGQKEHMPSVHVLADGTIKWNDCVAKQSVIIYGVY